jgi:hypothetical protein
VAAAVTLESLRAGFDQPADAARVMMRWWWFGPAVYEPEIDRELAAMAAAGLGGVELAFVYPLGDTTATFGSARFHALVGYAARRARELGLRFDLTLGSGWSFGGPHIDTAHAARCLHWDVREIGAEPMTIPLTAQWPGDEVVVAYLSDGAGLADAGAFQRLPVEGGRLEVPAGNRPRTVTIATSRLTGQSVKRAAAGAEGPVLDHYSAAATRAHLAAVAEPLLAAVGDEPVGSVFCDSLEVYRADWTPRLPVEFAGRHGYDPLERLYLLAADRPDSAGFRADFYRTLSQLYAQNFVDVVGGWARERDVPFRIQSYGIPPASLTSYHGADICEGEGWAWTGIPETRWASSAAHALGRDVVSAETWTWVHSPSFRATPLDLQGEAHEHFLNGVNHLIGHGWPYSPADAPGLGWFFYASGALDDRNAWWAAMPGLAGHLQRLCWLLRQGEPVRDIGVYVPTNDAYNGFGPSISGSLNLWRQSAALIGTDVAAAIRNHGWDFDLIDDDTLGAPGDRAVVVLASVTSVSESMRRWLGDSLAAGTAVVAIDCADLGVDSVITCPRDDLTGVLAARCEPDVRIDPPATGVGVVHRRLPDTDIYFVANTSNTTQAFTVTPRQPAAAFERWNPTTGERGPAEAAPVSLQLAPYQAIVLVATPDRPDGPHDTAACDSLTTRALTDGWQVTFLDDPAPASSPVTLPHRWEEDAARATYSGSAAYELDVALTAVEAAGAVQLDLGETVPLERVEPYLPLNSYRAAAHTPVGVSAQVLVNDRLVATVWAPPFTVDLTGALTPGRNRLRIVVANTTANRLSADRAIHALEHASTRRYGRRFRMQHLDHAADALDSGLLHVPTLEFSART